MMTTPGKGKSYLKEFNIFRTNAIRKRRSKKETLIFSKGVFVDEEDRVNLLREEEEQITPGIPSYVGQSEAFLYRLSRVKTKVEKINSLHKNHLSKPTLEDDETGKSEIEEATKELLKAFSSSCEELKTIQKSISKCTGAECSLTKNLVSTLGSILQEITESFRTSQNEYLKTVELREKNTKKYFSDFDNNFDDDDFDTIELDSQWTKQDILLVESNSKMIKKREKDIQGVVESIVQINNIFQDLVKFVSDQSATVDRIDCNIEASHSKINDGLSKLKQAEKYQKKDKKMHCITLLAVIVIVLFFMLMIKISS